MSNKVFISHIEKENGNWVELELTKGSRSAKIELDKWDLNYLYDYLKSMFDVVGLEKPVIEVNTTENVTEHEILHVIATESITPTALELIKLAEFINQGALNTLASDPAKAMAILCLPIAAFIREIAGNRNLAQQTQTAVNAYVGAIVNNSNGTVN